MSGIHLYPRLPTGAALQLIRAYESLPLADLAARSSLEHPAATYNPVGGRRVSRDRLELLRSGMREVAEMLRFPEPLGRRTGEFDRVYTELLYRGMGIVPADAGHEGVWSFVSLVLTPELPVWRYPSRNEERLRGLPRNAFRRLWWRAHTLGHTSDSITYRLTEDQLVQIEERPTIGGDPRVARALANALEKARERFTDISYEDLMREGAKYFIRLTPSISVYSLSDQQLLELAGEVMYTAAVALSADSPQSSDQSSAAERPDPG